MKVLIVVLLLSLAVFVRARSLQDYSPEEEHFALGVDDDGKGGQTRDLQPAAQCLWDWLVCGNKRPKGAPVGKCGRIYRECLEAIKKGKTPAPPVPDTPLPPPPVDE
eukprot:Seg1787.11 transcript_id=Seg1787.11/GoldUCD/mRNA.D3Y31 product="hypothetical protein" protein_id=Seg1787.11/GoldUCD/D3Y31